MAREASTEKVMVLGIDALDPRLTRKYVDMGIMPAAAELIKRGSAREDLVLLGAMPTVTPPQWTTLATGAYPETHEITAFFRQGGDLDLVDVNFSSLNCKAEQMWNITAENGKKTLVWHWPGSAWPPSSDSPNLHVVDGTSPGSVNMSTAQLDTEYLVVASPNNVKVAYRAAAANGSEVPCVVTGMDEEDTGSGLNMADTFKAVGGDGFPLYIYDPLVGGQGGYIEQPIDAALSPIHDADDKWAAAPAGAKEFTLLYSGGLIRRPALILQNEAGVYDSVAIYKNKKATEPMAVIHRDEYVRDIFDEAIKNDQPVRVNRDMRMMELAEDGSYVKLWVSSAMNSDVNMMWHPKELHQEILDNIGYPPPTATLTMGDKTLMLDCMNLCWEHTMDWQSDALNYLMENDGYEVVFSHFHAPDLQEHMFIRDMKKGRPNCSPAEYEEIMQTVYKQADRYIGKFLHFLDEGWTILLVSDHAQVCPTWGIRGLGDTGLNIQLMEELGFTALQKDENGETIFDEPMPGYKLPRIDWTKTKAVANREMHIYLNLKGRNQHKLPDGTVIDGIVDPAEQYQLEEEIMTALYGHKDKESGQRIIAFALRRKDARLMGLGGEYPQCGDIIYCMAEGYEHDHDDSLSTSLGECDTSVSPIFVAAGPGIKEDFYTKRVIRQVDVAPTIAALLGMRMPAQCEGAPIYQILANEF